MSSIKDFKCTYDNGVLEHSKIVEELGFTKGKKKNKEIRSVFCLFAIP